MNGSDSVTLKISPLQAVRTGFMLEKKATLFLILLLSFDGSQFICFPNSSGFFPMKSSHNLDRKLNIACSGALKPDVRSAINE